MQQAQNELERPVNFAWLKTAANWYLMVSAAINVAALVRLVYGTLFLHAPVWAIVLAGVAIAAQLAYTVWKIRNERAY